MVPQKDEQLNSTRTTRYAQSLQASFQPDRKPLGCKRCPCKYVKRSAVTGEQGGAVSVLRLSGSSALHVASQVFRRHGKHGIRPWQAKSHRIYYGHVVDQAGTAVDEVKIAVAWLREAHLCAYGELTCSSEQ